MTIRQFRRMFQPKVASRIKASKDGCWLWTGPVTKDGYVRVNYRLGGPAKPGRPRRDGSNVPAHPMKSWGLARLIWTVLYGTIPEGMQVGHSCHDLDPVCPGGPTCRHRRCGNPAHLSLQSHEMNTAMAMRFPRPRPQQETRRERYARDGVCVNGHDVSRPSQVYVYPSGRHICRTCHYIAKYGHLPTTPCGRQQQQGAA